LTLLLALAVVAVSGFISLSYEILWYRAISFVSGGVPSGFGVLLGFYLIGLALGAYASRAFCGDAPSLGDRRYLRYVAGFVLLANVVGFLVLPVLAWLATTGGWAPALGLIALASAMLGAVLPLVSHFAIAPDRLAGTHLSYLYSGNIVGSVLGSFLTGFVLLDRFPLPTVALGLIWLGLLTTAALLLLGRLPTSQAVMGCVALAALAIGAGKASAAGFHLFWEKLLFGPRFSPTTPFADLVENRSGVITVTSDGTVYGSGGYDGRISTSLVNDRNKIERAYALAVLHPAPSQVLMIGLSTGAWAQVIANNPKVEKLTVVEINPGYVSLIAKYPQVASVLRNPKVEIIVDDGRRWLTRHPRRFDLIVCNNPQHWRAHTTNLLSLEYTRLIREHLRPGGVYYFNTTWSTAALKTALTVFPYGVRFMSFVAVSASPIPFDRDRWREVLEEYRIDGERVLDVSVPVQRRRLEELTRAPDVEDREAALRRLTGAGVITDDNMLAEWHPSVER
jgi:spermidine synthase